MKNYWKQDSHRQIRKKGGQKGKNCIVIIRKATRKIKNKKATDGSVWKAAWIKEEVEEMVKNYIYILFNRIRKENQIQNSGNRQQQKVFVKTKLGKHSKESNQRVSGELNINNTWKCIKNTEWKR